MSVLIGDFLEALESVNGRYLERGIRISPERLLNEAMAIVPGGDTPVEGGKESEMANGYNRVTMVGNLGKDPEVRFAKSGTAVCNLRLAVTEREKRGDSYEDVTEWVDATVFGKTAENCGEYLNKGSKVLVEGKLQTRKWQDKEGNDRYSTEVKAFRVVFMDSKKDGQAPRGGGRPQQSQSQGGFDDDGDLPF